MTFVEGAYIILQERGNYMEVEETIKENESRPGFFRSKAKGIIYLATQSIEWAWFKRG